MKKLLYTLLFFILWTSPLQASFITNSPPTIQIANQQLDEELILDKKLQKIKQELLSLYKNNFPYDIPILEDERLSNSKLYQFVLDLPKGADLHVHCSEIMSIADFIEFISQNERIFISNRPERKLIYLTEDANIPDEYINFQNALKNGIVTKEELIAKWTLGASEYNSTGIAWVKFEKLFEDIDIIKDLPDEWIYKYYYEAFLKYQKNNINHLELRRVIKTDINKERKMQHIIRQAYYDVKKIYPDFSVKIIGNGLKYHKYSIKNTKQRLENTKILQKEIKDESQTPNTNFIIGFDMVNEEDTSRPISEYSKLLKQYVNRDMNLYMHAGETTSQNKNNINTAYKLGSKRIGHGYNLYMFQDLMNKFKKNNITLEICPISNQRLGYIKDLRKHPAKTYLNRGIPIVIASDDPIFMEKTPLVDDWFSVIISWDLNLEQIKQICMNSILYSGLTTQEKEQLLNRWEKQWNDFVKEQNKKL